MENPLISIIVPVYNVEKYLERCVDSVVGQTYKNIEIFLVDDGSTDNSGEMCDCFEKNDSRIKVLHKKNGGLSDARNAALDIFSGEYVTFIDSDDYVSPQYIEILYNALKNTDSDISIAGHIRGNDTNYNFKENKQCVNTIKMTNEECLNNWHDKYINVETTAWGKLYKSGLFRDNNIRYPKGKIFEDMYTTHIIVKHSQNVCIVDNEIYYYFNRNDSIIHTQSVEKLLMKYDALTQRLEWFSANGYTDASHRLLIKQVKHIIKNMVSCKNESVKKYMYDEFEKYYKQVKKIKKTFLDTVIFGIFKIWRNLCIRYRKV